MSFFSETFEAIGVSNQVTVVNEAALPTALTIARMQVRALDDACSRFRDDSELARLNRDKSITASRLLVDALNAALVAAESTGGLVDPTVGRSIRELGYDRDFELIAHLGAKATFELRPAPGWENIRINRARGTITIPAGCEIDLGATAKAFAADRIATLVHRSTGAAVLVSLGGDIAVAGEAPSDGYPILVTDDSRATDTDGQVVAISSGGIATSSTTVRRWKSGEIELHHVIDPRTGTSAGSCWRTVSVAAANCLEANTASTAALILGTDAPGWLEQRNLSARLVKTDGSVQVTGGWPLEAPAPNTPDENALTQKDGRP